MKFVTYTEPDAAPRVGYLDGDDVVDAGFDGRHGRLHRGRRTSARTGRRPVHGPARTVASPHHPRLPRLRGPPQERLRRARQGDPRRVVLGARLLQGPARHRHRTRRGDPVARVHRQARPRARARRRHRHAPARTSPRPNALDHVFGYTIWNDMSARDTQTRELPGRHGPLQGQGLGRLERPRPVHRHRRRDRPPRRRPRACGSTESGGAATTPTAMHHTFEDMIAYASQGLTLRAGEILGSGTATGGSGLELDRWLQPGDVIEMEADRHRRPAATASDHGRPRAGPPRPTHQPTQRRRTSWHSSSQPSGRPRKARRSASRRPSSR